MALAAKCEAAVLEYLTKQNRPYSVNDVVLNLHKEHGKSAVQKALDVLVADARVKEKVGAVGGTNNTRGPRLMMTLVNLNLFLVIFEDKFDPHRKEQAIWD